jgi:hypothetical protein
MAEPRYCCDSPKLQWRGEDRTNAAIECVNCGFVLCDDGQLIDWHDPEQIALAAMIRKEERGTETSESHYPPQQPSAVGVQFVIKTTLQSDALPLFLSTEVIGATFVTSATFYNPRCQKGGVVDPINTLTFRGIRCATGICIDFSPF